MKKGLVSLAVLVSLVLVSTAAFGASSSSYIQASVEAKYEVNFTTANVVDAVLPVDGSGVKVGEVVITCNADTFQFKFHCSDAAYINSNTGYFVNGGGSVANASDRLAYQVYFPTGTGALNHTVPAEFPTAIGTAQDVTDTSGDNDYGFTNGGVTNGYIYDLNVVVTEGDMLNAEAGTYTSEITITVADI
ncbi:hypothetical protein ACFL57_00755 [Candidatus Margulisiibacteriota bacterium]